MKKINNWLHESTYTNPLSPACKQCAKGSKLVLLITGLCDINCYYCPLSFKKGGHDVIYADEWKLENESDTTKLLKEAEYIHASGAGITGGDPLIVWKRAATYITLLKETFGDKFHIHLYTSGLTNAKHIPDLIAAGLDEIRFHPLPTTWHHMEKNPLKTTIETTVKTGIDTAIEIPAIPKMEKQMITLIKWADNQGLRWVNLNELEFSERNYDSLTKKGYTVPNEISSAVQGSQDTALKVLTAIAKEDISIGVHYCSVSFKDGVQLTNRIKRRAKHIVKPYEIITKDGTLFKGGITHSHGNRLRILLNSLKKEYCIPSQYLFLDTEKQRIEIAPWILEKIANQLRQHGYECFLIEEYPTADRLEVERIPLLK